MVTLRTLIIVKALKNRPPYQILPHTNSYFHCLYSFLFLKFVFLSNASSEEASATSFSKGNVCQRIDWSTVRLYKKTSTCVHRISHAHLGKNAQMPWQKQSRQHCELRARRIQHCQRKGTYCQRKGTYMPSYICS